MVLQQGGAMDSITIHFWGTCAYSQWPDPATLASKGYSLIGRLLSREYIL